MSFSEKFLKIANSMITLLLTISFLIAGTYSVYALWDNNSVYAAAENVQLEMLQLKPVIDSDGGASFEELLAINPDVRGWLTMDNTIIDHPILQGETNLSYINTDVYGDFALAGSIFMDTRSDGEFNDSYSLIYGHDMVEGRMFGDLALYKDEKFFKENSTGTLILSNRAYNLQVYAILVLQSSDGSIFNPESYKGGLSELIEYAKENAMYIRTEMTEDLNRRADEQLQILSLTTCSAEFTDARTIVLAVMEPSITEE